MPLLPAGIADARLKEDYGTAVAMCSNGSSLTAGSAFATSRAAGFQAFL